MMKGVKKCSCLSAEFYFLIIYPSNYTSIQSSHLRHKWSSSNYHIIQREGSYGGKDGTKRRRGLQAIR